MIQKGHTHPPEYKRNECPPYTPRQNPWQVSIHIYIDREAEVGTYISFFLSSLCLPVTEKKWRLDEGSPKNKKRLLDVHLVDSPGRIVHLVDSPGRIVHLVDSPGIIVHLVDNPGGTTRITDRPGDLISPTYRRPDKTQYNSSTSKRDNCTGIDWECFWIILVQCCPRRRLRTCSIWLMPYNNIYGCLMTCIPTDRISIRILVFFAYVYRHN